RFDPRARGTTGAAFAGRAPAPAQPGAGARAGRADAAGHRPAARTVAGNARSLGALGPGAKRVRQAAFIAAREDQWQAFAEGLKAMRRRKRAPDDVARLPERYRQLCGDLALARSRGYSLNLIHRLEDLVSRGHAVLYRSRAPLASQIIRFLAFGFPAL